MVSLIVLYSLLTESPFKKAMELRTTWIKQEGSFKSEPVLSSNPDFTQKEF